MLMHYLCYMFMHCDITTNTADVIYISLSNFMLVCSDNYVMLMHEGCCTIECITTTALVMAVGFSYMI